MENAVKHGITKKIDGGTVTIKTYEQDNDIIIEVSDDGVGLDLNNSPKDDRVHLGLSNTRNRVENICGGSLEFTSAPKEGAKVIIHIPQSSQGGVK